MFNKKKKAEVIDQEHTCRNCNTTFIGRFCPHCSQSIKEFEQPIGFMVVDFVGNMFAFDTRFWKTFKAVMYKPGHMANSFVQGHRVRYMPPFRFYIFISFIFFLLLNLNVSNNIKSEGNSDGKNKYTVVKDSIKKVQADSIVRAKLSEAFGKEKSDSIVNSIKDRIKGKTKKAEKDGYLVINGERVSDAKKANLEIKAKKLMKDAKAHPEFYISKGLSLVSWSLFLFMPFFAFLLWMFFNKSYKYYVIHLVFAINQHAFLFIVLSTILLIKMILPDIVADFAGYLMFTLPVYHFIGAKQLYRRKTKTTIFRLLAIGFIYWLTLFTGIAIMICIWLYFGYLDSMKWGPLFMVLIPVILIAISSIYIRSIYIKRKK
jgi:hypothetical protein